jgi:DNA-binding MarR family transcriptional regulator
MSPVCLEKFADRIIDLWPQLVRGLTKYEHNYLSEGKITLPQVWALHYLLKKKSCSMRELADFMMLGFSSMTGLVDRLVRQNLAVRDRTAEDRRMVHVRISSKGQRVLKQIFSQRRRAILNLYGTLSLRERTMYLHILEKLVGTLSSNSNGNGSRHECRGKR